MSETTTENIALERAKAMGWKATEIDDYTAQIELADTDDHAWLEYYPATEFETEAFVLWYGGHESQLLRTTQELKREYNKLLKLIYDRT